MIVNTETQQLKKIFLEKIVEKYGLFLGVNDLCELLEVSRPLVDQLIAIRDIQCVKIGKMYRISADEFVRWYYDRAQNERQQTQSQLVKVAMRKLK